MAKILPKRVALFSVLAAISIVLAGAGLWGNGVPESAQVPLAAIGACSAVLWLVLVWATMTPNTKVITLSVEDMVPGDFVEWQSHSKGARHDGILVDRQGVLAVVLEERKWHKTIEEAWITRVVRRVK